MGEINWANLLTGEDVEGLWNGLYQLISRHPAVRPLHFATDGAADVSPFEINADLTQELFLELFQKQRFEHYLVNEYTDTEIENEIAHIEVPNLVGARLRKRYPESFRMARRVSALLKSSPRFRRFGTGNGDAEVERLKKKPGRPSKNARAEAPVVADEDDELNTFADFTAEDLSPPKAMPAKRQRLVSQLFGLQHWQAAKLPSDSGHFADLIKSVAMRKRDRRVVGRSATSQLILSNPDLEDLIVEILEAIDSPADVRTLRQLVLSKIPLQDYNVASLDEELSLVGQGSSIRRDPADTRDTAEASLLRQEAYRRVADLANSFLHALHRAVNHNERRYSRLLATLWHCYFDSDNPSQIEIAEILGVSDSLVSDNRRLIEHELKKLHLSVEEGAVFSESLRLLIAPTSLVN